MKIQTIDLATYTTTPIGWENGRRWRDEVLIPALREGSVILDLDGVSGIFESWIEGAFGDLTPGDLNFITFHAAINYHRVNLVYEVLKSATVKLVAPEGVSDEVKEKLYGAWIRDGDSWAKEWWGLVG